MLLPQKLAEILAKLRHFLPRKTIINIYQALIYPILSYGIVAWGQACKTYLDKILILQKRVISMIFLQIDTTMQFPYLLMLTYYQ